MFKKLFEKLADEIINIISFGPKDNQEKPCRWHYWITDPPDGNGFLTVTPGTVRTCRKCHVEIRWVSNFVTHGGGGHWEVIQEPD